MGWDASRMPGKTARPTQSFLVRKRVAPPVLSRPTPRRFGVPSSMGGVANRSCLFWSTVASCRFTREQRDSNDRARRLITQDAMAPTSQQRCMHENRRPHSHGQSTVELSFRARVLVAVKIEEEATMGRGLLLWLIGIPIPIILLIWLFGGLHG